MAEENSDQSVKSQNLGAQPGSVTPGGDQAGAKKRRRRRRHGKTTPENQPRQTPRGDASSSELGSATLPPLTVNGQPYRPAETALASDSANDEVKNDDKPQLSSDPSKKSEQKDESILATAIAELKAETAIEGADAGESVLETMLAQKEARVSDHQLDVDRQPDSATTSAKPAASAARATGAPKSQRFTPRGGGSGLKNATPTFSLQDIQRARRRRNWAMLAILLILGLAVYFLWAGVRRLPWPGRDAATITSEQPSASTTPRPGEKATLSGHVNTDQLTFPAPAQDRVAIYIRPQGELEWGDTGIRLMATERDWRYSQATYDESYEIQAVLLSSGRMLNFSNIITASAPTAGIDLVFPVTGGDTSSRDALLETAASEPRLTLEEAPSISGLITIDGPLPEGAQVVIWVGLDAGEREVQQDAYTVSVASRETAYTLSNLQADRDYVLDATLQTRDGQTLATAATLIARSPSTTANFSISIK